MEMNSMLRDLTFKKSASTELRAAARRHGMITLQEDGVRKILSGATSIDEILRTTHREEFL
jgi:type II secretory ATPase GspE/PulE/Tfp pilus assembly ATPase PilB-like protein